MAKTERLGFEQVGSFFQNNRSDVKPFLAEGFMITAGKQKLPNILNVDTPYIIEDTRLLIVTSGEAEMEINFQEQRVTCGSVIVCNPGVIVKPHKIEGEYEVRGLMLSPTMVSSVFDEHLPQCVSTPADFAVFTPNAADMEMLVSIHALIYQACKVYGFQKRVVFPLVKSLIEVADMAFLQVEEQERQKLTRTDKLYNQFMRLVAEKAAEEHEIEFYAGQLCISNNYLSAIVKQTSGLTAKEWIDKAIVTQAKMLLKTTDLQSAQIANRLHFPNPSFFNRYFKRLTGLTPIAYKQLQ